MILQRRAIFAAGALDAIASGVRHAAAQPATPTAPSTLGYKQVVVEGGGGVPIHTYEYGNPDGVPILLVHGVGQCNLSWDRQVADPALAREFRLVTVDLRGHGLSGKPVGDEHYKPGGPWAGDIDAVMTTLNLRRPVLVGWSYGGRVLGDYLTAHGSGALGALNFVAAGTSNAPGMFGAGAPLTGPNSYGSADLRTALDATRKFLRVCFATQPAQDEFETMVGFMSMVPRHVRLSVGGRPTNYGTALKAVDVPTLVTQGASDQLALVAVSQYTAGLVPGARLSVYESCGHSTFWEDSSRYNRELAELARSARR